MKYDFNPAELWAFLPPPRGNVFARLLVCDFLLFLVFVSAHSGRVRVLLFYFLLSLMDAKSQQHRKIFCPFSQKVEQDLDPTPNNCLKYVATFTVFFFALGNRSILSHFKPSLPRFMTQPGFYFPPFGTALSSSVQSAIGGPSASHELQSNAFAFILPFFGLFCMKPPFPFSPLAFISLDLNGSLSFGVQFEDGPRRALVFYVPLISPQKIRHFVSFLVIFPLCSGTILSTIFPQGPDDIRTFETWRSFPSGLLCP